jgi:hypothetical protein
VTATEILAKRPSQLFPGDEAAVKRAFRVLAGAWHPDHCKDPQAPNVFQHLLRSRDAALRGEEGLERLVLTRKAPASGEGTQFALSYMHAGKCDAGQHYVSYSAISYLVSPDLDDLCKPAVELKWSFADSKMQTEMTKYLPARVKYEHTTQGTFLAYRRNSDQILLSDLLAWHTRTGQPMDYRHVMWIISSLLNTCCYLEIQQVAHCGLVPEYLLVSPDMHTVALTGPPLYATPFNTRPKAVPQAVLAAFPRMRSPDFKVDGSRVDLTMVRQLAMRALNRNNVATLKADKTLHAGLRDWLCSAAPRSALADYAAWEKLRGKRDFAKYLATAEQMYVALAA